MMKKLSIALAVSVLLLTGCTGITKSKAPPVSIYPLHAQRPENRTSTAAVIIPEPEMPAGLDTSRIGLYLAGGRRMDYYADATWPDSLPRVLQDVVIQSAPFSAIAPDTGVNAPYALNIKVNEFIAVYADTADGLPEARVSLTFHLVARGQEKILADFTVTHNAPVTANTVTEVTRTLENSLQMCLAEGLSTIRRDITGAKKKPDRGN
ncbi:MAG TPA: ABC-type transport auxiliary lipoprotein family protein [Patescibacteria group bacterium]|nr:ABC-type transport auxiliary lipoprotein family protein [Patescibacteria group bacterium]